MKSSVKEKINKRSFKKIILKILTFLVILVLYCLYLKYVKPALSEESIPQIFEGTMSVHFIDVGQSDATLFIQGDEVMLFDAASPERGDEMVKYIQDLGIEYIDVVILSHPHDDHMGGVVELLNNIEVGRIYGPNFFDVGEITNDGWCVEMIEAIEVIESQKNYGKSEEEYFELWHFPKNENGEFVKFNLGDAKVEFLAPFDDYYEDVNDYSICAKISFGEIDFLFTGDATKSVEKALIDEGYDLDVEIFQASHHGSKTGNIQKFLDAMSPECVVISCGMKNRYNHPTEEVIERFKEMELPVYRTDESGNIVLTTDGSSYSFNVKPGTYTSGKAYKGE